MTHRWNELRTAVQNSTARVGGGATEETIRVAEQQIGRFPEDYRLFLGEFGWLSIGPFEFFGLGNGIPAYLDVVQMTLLERAEAPGFPNFLVALQNNGGGDLFCYDSRQLDIDPPVLRWTHDEPDELESQSTGFALWVLSRLSVV